MGKCHLVGLRPGCSDADCCHYIHRLGGRVTERISPFRVLVVKYLDTVGEQRVLFHPDVEHIEKDYTIGLLKPLSRYSSQISSDIPIPWDPSWDRWGKETSGRTKIPWGVRSIDAPDVWPTSKGERATVAIVDTGIDVRHPDLEGRVIGGFSAVSSAAEDYHDENGHGTHVAGIVAATGVPGGVLGVAPRTNLIAVKVLDASGLGRLSTVVRGLAWIAQQKQRIPVVNMSLGGPWRSPLLLRAIEHLRRAGTLVVAASGNFGPQDNSVAYPARYLQTIAVGAYTPEEQVAGFSSRGIGIDLVAPGTDVDSTWLGHQYRVMDGTSMAAPHVAGVAALLWSVRRSAPEVRKALYAGVKEVEGTPHSAQGRGRINARLALEYVMRKESRHKKGTLTG